MIISDNLKLEIEKFALGNAFHFKPYKMKKMMSLALCIVATVVIGMLVGSEE